jgi:hypothetical protein
MKRILIIAMLVAFAQMASGFSPMPQTSPPPASLRRIEVNAKTITALAPGKNYIVDLTQRGVIYEFSPQAGQIDFSRVRVRTAQGEVAIGTFIEKTLPKDKLAGFKYKSQAFGLATRPSGTLQNPPTGASPHIGTQARLEATSITVQGASGAKSILCSRDACACIGPDDCTDLLNNGPCGGPLVCDFHAKPYFCYCTLNP